MMGISIGLLEEVMMGESGTTDYAR